MFLKYNIGGILWILLIFIACSTPGEQLPPSPFFDFDKLVHLFFYGTLQLLLLRGFYLQYQFKMVRQHYLSIAFIFSAGYGILIEVLQGHVFRNRSFDLFDMAANIIGVILATIIWIFILKRRMKPKTP